MYYLVEVRELGFEHCRVFLTNFVIERGKVHGRSVAILEELLDAPTFEVARMLEDDSYFKHVEGFGFFNY